MAKKIIPQENQVITELRNLILTWKISQVMLAQRMGMPEGTFRNRLNLKQHAYQFTEEEITKLAGIMFEMMQAIKDALVKTKQFKTASNLHNDTK